MTDDDKLEWIELPPDEEATVLTSISPQCLQEDVYIAPESLYTPMPLIGQCFACMYVTK